MGNCTMFFRKSCHLVWKHFSNLMGYSRGNIRTLVIWLFQLYYRMRHIWTVTDYSMCSAEYSVYKLADDEV